MIVIRSLYFIATILEVAKSSAEADNVSVLAQSLSESKHMVRGSGSNDEKETGKKNEETSSVNKSPKRMLEAVTKQLLQLKSIDDDYCYDISYDRSSYPSFVTSSNPSNPPSIYPSPIPSINRYKDKDFFASDGSEEDWFGRSCSISDELVVIGAIGVDDDEGAAYDNEGAAYVFHLDGTEVAKLTPGDDVEDFNSGSHNFGFSVSIDKKIVVGMYYGWYGGYVQVFSPRGIYERTIRCDGGCWEFGRTVATHGNLIVTEGEKTGFWIDDDVYQDRAWTLYLYTTEGEFIKSFEHENLIFDVSISEQFIVTTAVGGKTIIYSNSSPDFPKITEINQRGLKVAVSNDRIVIGHYTANDNDGAAYLYKTDGTFVKSLYRKDASSGSKFGGSVAITDDKVFVGAIFDDDQGYHSGSVFIYSAVTGWFLEKVLAPDAEAEDYFGRSLCASDSHYVVGAPGFDGHTGAAYLFQL